MALRKASAYTKKKTRPYTRKSNVKSKSYIKTIPQQKIVKFQMGDLQGYKSGKLSMILRMKTREKALIRDNALESARQHIHRQLEKEFSGQYFFALRVYPHHILRENKMLTGAGADRMQTGMQLSFGRAVGRASLIKTGKEIFMIAVNNEKALRMARKALEKIRPKLPCKTTIIFEKR